LERISCGVSAICRTESKEEKGSSDKTGKIASLPSSRLSSLADDEAASEFRHKIASLQNLVILEYETAFSWSTATSSSWMAFFETP
jgi:hypothetical protein